ncbi:LPD7 domain-containing protein [Novosphingobium sp. KA1]|uniref:relaxase/mobilization nuclease domain-containing protein n=1 Tax=Novosphingobium sp. (strain KA1) TaxID=164608 RepID=UPI001A908BF9|nr:LPD7 domain-containing protein [Novosphingobium sp. KA1]QSR17436.1 hypothetical protein CA833_09615 [Novosphingobium sp. KA1]
MIVKLIKVARQAGVPTKLRDDVFALTRYVVDADPWALAMVDEGRVRSLTEYLHHAQEFGVEPGEKAGHVGKRNLVGETLREQQIEMLATASAAPRVEYPMVHIIVSWRTGEVPTPAQVDEAVDIMLTTAGLDRSAALYAEHVNTASRHVHIAALRIDRATGAAAGSEWLIDDLHQALSIIEERQGWSAEPNALYYARGGAVFDAKAQRVEDSLDGSKRRVPGTEVMIRDAAGQRVRVRDRNAITPAMLNKREGILEALAASTNWAEFHARLHKIGVSYEGKGSGARIHIGEQSEKASQVARTLSLSTLQAKWGGFEPNETVRDDAFEKYRAAHKAQLARLRADRTAAVASIRAWATTTIKALPRGGSTLVNAAVLAERDAAIRQLEEVFKAAIKRCTDARFTQADAWKGAGSPNLPEIVSPSLLLPVATGYEAEWQAPAHLRAEPDEWRTRYFDADDRLVLTDHGNIIVVNQPGMPDAIDAALLMASQRWGRVRVRGSEAFLRRCAERGAVLGLSLVGPEGLPLIAVSTTTPMPDVVTEPKNAETLPLPAQQIDPVRQATIDRLLSDLAEMGAIPVRRAADGHLQVEYEDDRFAPRPELRMASLFDEDPQIQAFLRHQRESMIGAVERHLASWEVAPDKDAVLKSLAGRKDRLARAAFLAFDDPDFAAMLERIELSRLERERRIALDVKQGHERIIQPEPKRREAEIEAEMPIHMPGRGGIAD